MALPEESPLLRISGQSYPCSPRSAIISQSEDGSYLALVSGNDCDIQIICDSGSTDNKQNLQVTLKLGGHRCSPQCLTFSHTSEPTLLISSAKDYIIKWNITECLINQHNGVAVRGAVVMQTPDEGVNHISLNLDDHLMAICTGCDVNIYSLQKSEAMHCLTGHSDRVTCAEFCPHYDSTLVTASVDRTYLIWNSDSGDILYKSCIISSSPFDHLMMSQNTEEFILVSNDGMIRVFDISSNSTFSEQKALNIEKILRDSEHHSQDDDGDGDSMSSLVLSVTQIHIPLEPCDYEGRQLHPDNNNLPDNIRSLFSQIDLLVVLTASHCLVINSQTCDPVAISSLTECGLGCVTYASLLPLTSDCEDEVDTSTQSDVYSDYNIRCITHGMMDDKLVFSAISPLQAYIDSQKSDLQLSVINKIPVLLNSPLRSSLVPKLPKPTPKKKPGAKYRPKLVKKTGFIHDEPVVFRTKVKSSGYSTTHSKSKFFQPQTKFSNVPCKTSSSAVSSHKAIKEKVYPHDAQPISKIKGDCVAIDSRPTQIMNMNFSLDGQNLSVACGNQQAVSFRLPLNGAKSTVYAGHTGVVNSCTWSYSGQYLVTSSNDKTVRVWSKDQGTSHLSIDRIDGNMTALTESQARKTQCLPHETKHAQFFYLDKFILVACGNTLLMYKYHLDTTKSDIKRYENGSRYKLVTKCQMDSAQHITSMSAINTFYSHLVLTTGSDRSVQVFDMNASSQCRIIEDCHNKPAHSVTQNKGSLYSNLHSTSYDLFLTTATGDGVKLWDLRAPSGCVRKFEGHISKGYQCGCDMSPDGRYVSVGSEDRSFYIYDVGSGKSVSRVKGLSDVCSSVIYHPLYTQLAAGTISGNVAMYES